MITKESIKIEVQSEHQKEIEKLESDLIKKKQKVTTCKQKIEISSYETTLPLVPCEQVDMVYKPELSGKAEYIEGNIELQDEQLIGILYKKASV